MVKALAGKLHSMAAQAKKIMKMQQDGAFANHNVVAVARLTDVSWGSEQKWNWRAFESTVVRC